MDSNYRSSVGGSFQSSYFADPTSTRVSNLYVSTHVIKNRINNNPVSQENTKQAAVYIFHFLFCAIIFNLINYKCLINILLK